MTPQQVRVQNAFIELGGGWSEEFINATVAVANEAATDAFARAAVELWIRGQQAEMIRRKMGDIDLWANLGGLLVRMFDGCEVTEEIDSSIRSSLAAVEKFLNP